MLLRRLVLVFLVVPALLVSAVAQLGPAAGRAILYLAFPIGIVTFALSTLLRERDPHP